MSDPSVVDTSAQAEDHRAALRAAEEARNDATGRWETAQARVAELEAENASLTQQLREAHDVGRAQQSRADSLQRRVDELQLQGALPANATFVAGRSMSIVGPDGISSIEVAEGDELDVSGIPHLKTWIESGHILVRDRAPKGKRRSHADPHMAPAAADPRQPRGVPVDDAPAAAGDDAVTDSAENAAVEEASGEIAAAETADLPDGD